MVIWFSRLLRWGLGLGFAAAGFYYERNWPAILFGAALFITGFFRPKRCVADGCENS